MNSRIVSLLKVYCFDNNHLMNIILNTIQRIPYVQTTDTILSLEESFERQVWVKDMKNPGFVSSL